MLGAIPQDAANHQFAPAFQLPLTPKGKLPLDKLFQKAC